MGTLLTWRGPEVEKLAHRLAAFESPRESVRYGQLQGDDEPNAARGEFHEHPCTGCVC